MIEWKNICWKCLRAFFVALISFTLVLGMTILLYPLPSFLPQITYPETSKIYDRHGELIHEILDAKRGRYFFVPLDGISKHVIETTIATEDRDFYSHLGIDPGAILRAIWQNIEAGKIVSGGSTIPQQLVRNLMEQHTNRTLWNKIEESIFAIQLSFWYDKDEMLEAYLNTIYYGNLLYGIETASRHYFGKSAADLSLAESAFLVGLPQSPENYNPWKYFDRAKNRQKQILSFMEKVEYIDTAERILAETEPIVLKKENTPNPAPHFSDIVIANMTEHLGSDRLQEGGISIHTTLDIGLQKTIAKLANDEIQSLSGRNVSNCAVVVMDTATGDILALLGSVNPSHPTFGAFNVALAKRQPGSAIKPLIYALAFDKGWLPSTAIEDGPSKFETEEGFGYFPKNFDLEYHGTVTARQALGSSLNIPAVKTLEFVGVPYFLQKSLDFGISTYTRDAEQYGLSLALGAGEVQLLELVEAFSSFAGKGEKVSSRFISYFKDSGEKTELPVAKNRVLDEEIAAMVTDVLSDNSARIMSFGEDSILNTPYSSAVKTGTTRNFKDNWTVGYSPQYLVGVWVGNNDNSPMKNVSGITGAAPLWRKIMDELHKNPPHEEFSFPGTLEKRPFCLEAQCFSEIFFRNRRSIAGSILNKSENYNELILSPFHNDRFKIDPDIPLKQQKLQLKAKQEVEWFINDKSSGVGQNVNWPLEAGAFEIRAEGDTTTETVTIYVE